MKKYLRSITMVALWCVSVVVCAQKPNVHILATGGTIAGSGESATQASYSAGEVAIETLLDAVPQIKEIANVTGEQIVNIGSQDMNEDVWLLLAKRINELLSSDDVDAVVVTHGTDTMEETAYFLDLTAKRGKSVVLVGAMRPSTAMSADGPLNLYNAVVTAISPESKDKGVVVAMNGLVLAARDVMKASTTGVQAFQSPNKGPLGYINDGKVFYLSNSLKRSQKNAPYDISHVQKLPKVGIAYGYAGVSADIIDPFLANDYSGIIYSGVGNGNIYKDLLPQLQAARKKGVVVVRASRVPVGAVTLGAEVDDTAYQFVASKELNPQKARVLLMLALTVTNDWKLIQECFNTH
ncbi:MAG: L-asparaginase 2 [Phocaeicola sp.]